LFSKLSKLRDVFKKFVDSAASLLTSKDKLLDLLEDLKLELISRDVAYEAAEDIAGKLRVLILEGEIRDRKTLLESLRGGHCR